MAVGGFVADGGGFDGKITASVVITCIVAASGGLIFGYDIGISGRSTLRFSFQFFFSVLYCFSQVIVQFDETVLLERF